MSGLRKFDHVERYGHPDVDGLDIGIVYVFPKLDGTNASVWVEDHGEGDDGRPVHHFHAGSRTRELTFDEDNAGFLNWICEDESGVNFAGLFADFPWWRLYGEWLVPHTLKTYREDAWRRFYVFDVYDDDDHRYLPYDGYATVLRSFGFDMIEPLCTITNPTEEQLRKEVEANTYLIRDGCGAGEGIVIKNYEWRNKYGRQPWAKIVRTEFKEENRRQFGTPEKTGRFQVEAAIAEEFVTAALVDKERAKIRVNIHYEEDLGAGLLKEVDHTHRSQVIPRLLQTVYHAIVAEEIWTAIKRHKDPTIDFKLLRKHVIHYTKKYAGDLF